MKTFFQIPQSDMLDRVMTDPRLSSRWKSAIITSSLKLLLLPSFSILFAWRFHEGLDISLSTLVLGFAQINPANPLFIFFLGNIICSFTGYCLGWLACTMAMERLCFCIPLFLATPIAFIIIFANEACDRIIFTQDNPDECTMPTANLALVICSAICLYIAQLLTGYCVFRGKAIIMERESQVNYCPHDTDSII